MSQDRFVLGTFSAAGGPPFVAMVKDGRVIALRAFAARPALASIAVDTMLDLLERWDRNWPLLEQAAAMLATDEALAASSVPEETLRPFPPVNLPRQIFCTGANYRKHVIELIVNDPDMRGADEQGMTDPAELRRRAEIMMDERAQRAQPYSFIKLPSAVIGAQDDVRLPPEVKKPDWELELAVVIGRRCRRVTPDQAADHIAGYAIVNDLTARDLVFRRDKSAIGADWLSGKSWPTFMPFGPYLVPRAFLADPYGLQIRLAVNGTTYQDESTADMMIGIDRQIAFLSERVELLPGDLIVTGSPAGNGSMHGVFLKAGDVMEGEITGLGRQRNRCVADA